MRIFGIDPGSERTGYGCVDTDGSRYTIVVCGAIRTPPLTSFPDKLLQIHSRLADMLRECRPDCVAIENVFHSVNVRSALKLGHARGVAMLAAVQAGLPVMEYTPAEIKKAVVGYGRADKPQVQQMVKLLLRLPSVPTPHDAADALAVALCHLHSQVPARVVGAMMHVKSKSTNWRTYRPASAPLALRLGKPASAPAALPPSRLPRYGATSRRDKPVS